MMNVMKTSDFHRLLALAIKWDFICIICGTGFANLACITVDHIIPRSRGGKGDPRRIGHYNLAPAHHQCNYMKKDNGLLETAKRIEKTRSKLGDKQFHQWVNKKVPGREVPVEALLPLTSPKQLTKL